METIASHSWFVTTAYAAAALCIVWLLMRTYLRHLLAKRALAALTTETSHETQA